MKKMLKFLLFTLTLVVVFVLGAANSYLNRSPARLMRPAFEEVRIAMMGETQRKYYLQEIAGERDSRDTSADYTIKDNAIEFKSKNFDQTLTVLPDVFDPNEADGMVLPLMRQNAELFKGKRVLEIGTGSGIISLFAAKLGAVKVVSTDINPNALESLNLNAEKLGFTDIISPRLVPLDDMSAYSVIEDAEQFDIIISNPPFALDLDADKNTALVDRGDLGFSIVRGLEKHLDPNGKVILLYGSLYYHNIMVKFARYSGYTVRHNNPNILFPWAAETLYNAYLRRLLEVEGLPRDAFRFDRFKDQALDKRWLGNPTIRAKDIDFDRLLPGDPKFKQYWGGFLVIEPKTTS